MKNLRVLITGPSGRVGRYLLPDFIERYTVRTLSRRPVPGSPDHVAGNIADVDAVRRAMDGIEVLVHLAAEAWQDEPWHKLVSPNIYGCHAAFSIAHECGVRRIVYASSCHTVMGYPRTATVAVDDPPRPPDLYGVTKVFGEALGRYYHDIRGMEFISVRLGGLAPRSRMSGHEHGDMRYLWVSPRDCVKIFRLAVEQPLSNYTVVHGTSRLPHEFMSLSSAKEALGYEPDDAL